MGTRRRGHGEGSIYRRSRDQKLIIAVSLPDGRRITRVARPQTMAGARRQLDALKRELDGGRRPAPSRLSVADYLTRWLAEDLPLRAPAPRTVAHYTQRLHQHVLPHVGRIRLAELRPADVQAMLVALRGRGLAASTINVTLSVLRSALADAERLELAPRNAAAAVRRLRESRRTVPPLSIEEALAVLDAVQGTRIAGVVTLGLLYGLRQGELLGLRWADVDESRLTVTGQLVRGSHAGAIPRGPTKTRAERRLPLVPAAVAALDAQRGRQDAERRAAGPAWRETGYVFTTPAGTPIHHRTVTSAWTAALAAAGLPHRHFHDLRHGANSLLAWLGVPIEVRMEIVGHTVARTNLDYTHVPAEVVSDALGRLSALLRGQQR